MKKICAISALLVAALLIALPRPHYGCIPGEELRRWFFDDCTPMNPGPCIPGDDAPLTCP